MKIKIKKGWHYPWAIPIGLPIWVKKNDSTKVERKFKFTDSCMFDLHDEDQWDVNKLFGFSIGHHHDGSSFRFGWRPILNNNTIEIVAYEYHNGVRIKTMSICEVELNKWYRFRLTYIPHLEKTHYLVTDIKKNTPIKNRFFHEFTNEFYLSRKFGLGYTLGIYFGGNEKAPQDIVIHKKRK